MNIDYFINKFEAIPEDKWCCHKLTGEGDTHCVLGHCSADEQFALYKLCTAFEMSPVSVNDGRVARFNQPTPKARILAAMRDMQRLFP